MAADGLLSESKYCRLCGELNENGIELYLANENQGNSEPLSNLVNRYLPLSIEHGDMFPRTICPGCHIQLESTKLFLDLIVKGQEKLRQLLKAQQQLVVREQKQRKNLEKALKDFNVNASIDTYSIQCDEDGEKYVIQIHSEGPLFLRDHELSLKTGARKRGRPSGKSSKLASTENQPTIKEDDQSKEVCPNDLGRGKRKVKAPTRFGDAVEGSELVNVLKKEGALTDDDILEESKLDGIVKLLVKSQDPLALIGMALSSNENEHDVQPVFAPFSKIRMKEKNISSLICDICKKAFVDKASLDIHQGNCILVKSSNQEESIKSDIKHTGSNNSIKIEPVNEEQKRGFLCPECSKSFSCRQNYEVHFKAVHQLYKPFVCTICHKCFAYANSLKSHMVTHNSQLDNPECLTCDLCKKKFNHQSSLEYHKQVEHGDNRYACNRCDRVFKHKQILLRHQMVHSKVRQYKCEQCGTRFKTKNNLTCHQKTHKGNKVFVCSSCGKGFKYQSSLLVHVKSHSDGDKPYKCEYCTKTFDHKGNYNQHRRIHTGEKPFKCEECTAAFVTSSQYKIHMRRHSETFPFTCKTCQKRFNYRKPYEVHLRRHSGEKPFKCRFCGQSFPDQWGQNRHEGIHLGVRYKCDQCEKSFASKAGLDNHKKKNSHGILDKPEYILTSTMDDDHVEKIKQDAENLEEMGNNSISIKTAEGESVSLVSSGGNKFQGFLSDGTLVSFDIVPEGADVQMQVNETSEVASVSEVSQVNLLDSQIQFIEEDVAAPSEANLANETKVLVIGNLDGTAFLSTD